MTSSSLWLSRGLSIITMSVRKTKQWSVSTTALNITVTIGTSEVELTYKCDYPRPKIIKLLFKNEDLKEKGFIF